MTYMGRFSSMWVIKKSFYIKYFHTSEVKFIFTLYNNTVFQREKRTDVLKINIFYVRTGVSFLVSFLEST